MHCSFRRINKLLLKIGNLDERPSFYFQNFNKTLSVYKII